MYKDYHWISSAGAVSSSSWNQSKKKKNTDELLVKRLIHPQKPSHQFMMYVNKKCKFVTILNVSPHFTYIYFIATGFVYFFYFFFISCTLSHQAWLFVFLSIFTSFNTSICVADSSDTTTDCVFLHKPVDIACSAQFLP